MEEDIIMSTFEIIRIPVSRDEDVYAMLHTVAEALEVPFNNLYLQFIVFKRLRTLASVFLVEHLSPHNRELLPGAETMVRENS
ncbi:hypothetical protein J6590_022965 [Homalodisca vitripennis]|nr:hypothetical protein J6590_022965 [Homalodisca vitripennis]